MSLHLHPLHLCVLYPAEWCGGDCDRGGEEAEITWFPQVEETLALLLARAHLLGSIGVNLYGKPPFSMCNTHPNSFQCTHLLITELRAGETPLPLQVTKLRLKGVEGLHELTELKSNQWQSHNQNPTALMASPVRGVDC